MKILRSKLSRAMSAMASSLSGIMDILKLGFQCVWWRMAWIFSIVMGFRSNLCIRLCSGVGCCLTSLNAALVTGLCKGWKGGSVARQRAAP